MDKLDDFLLGLYRAAREVPLGAFREVALTGLKTIISFDSARWGTVTHDERGAAYHTAHLHQDSPDSLRDYNEFRSDDTAARLVFAHPDKTLSFPLFSFYPQTSKGLRAYIRRYRHEHGLITAHRSQVAGLYQTLSIYGAYENRPFGEEQRKLTELFFPHLCEALKISQTLHLERLRTRFEGCEWAIALCDPAGYYCLVEPRFADLTGREWSRCSPSRLPGPLIQLISARQEQWLHGSNAVFRVHVEHDFVFVRARSRLPVDALSRRELEVARHIAVGRTHKEIAKLLHISPATVRNHVQAIHERVGVHNNAELAAQLKNAMR